MRGISVRQRIKMRFRHNQKMYVCDRMNIVKGDHIVVFIQFLRRDFAVGELAKQAIAHCVLQFIDAPPVIALELVLYL